MNGLTLQVPTPFVSYDEFSRLTGLPINTIKNMVADGRLKIRPKIRAKDKPLISIAQEGDCRHVCHQHGYT